MQVVGDIFEVHAQDFYEQDFSCKLFLTGSLRRISKNIKAFNAYFAVLFYKKRLY